MTGLLLCYQLMSSAILESTTFHFNVLDCLEQEITFRVAYSVEPLRKYDDDGMCLYLNLFFLHKGMIEPSEVQAAMIKLGINVDLEEAEQLTKRSVNTCDQTTVLIHNIVNAVKRPPESFMIPYST